MNKKLLGISICIILFGAIICPSIAGYNKDFEKIDYILNENKKVNLKNDDNNNLIKQVIENRVISNDDWSEQEKLLVSDGAAYDEFGRSVSINGDYGIVGAYLDDNENGNNSGAAYIFKRNGITWTEEQKLTASDGAKDDRFGVSVSINGVYAIVGAYLDDDNGENSGSVYVFKYDGESWKEETKLTPSDKSPVDLYGTAVSLDGDKAFIGAPGDDENGDNSGSVYVYKRSGITWSLEAKLVASDRAGGECFGVSVAFDDNTALIGAPGDDDNGYHSGSAYVFRYDGINWNEKAKLLASNGAEDDNFGFSVSISGNYAIIGLPGKGWGSAYVFKHDGLTWVEEAKLTPLESGSWFGLSVSIDGDYALIGYPLAPINIVTGIVYVFKRSGTTWSQEVKLTALDGESGDLFGWSVSFDRNTALIGAYLDNDNGIKSGSAYVFINNGDSLHDLTIEGLSPIDLNVSDANGHFINKNFSNIPFASYIEMDLDGDEELDDWVFIPNAIDGLYTIEVIPEQDAEPTDTYSLKVTLKDVSYYLAMDIMIQDIPPEGYSFSWPDKPSIPDGPISGKIGETYVYTSSTNDPDGNQVIYLFDWGDGTDSGWLETGEGSHTWSGKGCYNIRVKAKDTHGFESRWSNPLIVTMPINKALESFLFYHFLEQYLIIQKLLQRLRLQ